MMVYAREKEQKRTGQKRDREVRACGSGLWLILGGREESDSTVTNIGTL